MSEDARVAFVDDLFAAEHPGTVAFWISIDGDSRTVVRIEEPYTP